MMPKYHVRFLLLFFAASLLTALLSLPARAALPKLENLFMGSSSPAAFLPVSKAFIFNFSQQDNTVVLRWQIADGYYLYQDKILVTAQNASIAKVTLPNGEPYHDEFFGEVEIYRNQLEVSVSLDNAGDNAALQLGYQGCASAGFCYPPESISIPLNPVSAASKAEPTAAATSTSTSTTVTSLQQNWWQPLLFLALGIGLAFTPCVLPMYPILAGIVLTGTQKSPLRTFSLAMLYVQGMALTYTLLGLVVASAGLQFQAAMQHPAVLITISLLFVLLAAAMFGAFSLALPANLQTKLAIWSNQQQGGSYKGVFVMGAISGLVCSPCTTAPLSGALLYVAKTGDLFTGSVTLYALALGMGIPLIIFALFGNRLLPKAGLWMEKVKTLFGFILLAAPLFFLARLVSENTSTVLWLSWLACLSGWLYHQSRELAPSKKASFCAVVAIIGLAFSTVTAQQLFFASSNNGQQHALPFIKIKTVADLEQQLAKAKQANKPVMVDFYADWCVACKEYEKYTFSQPAVRTALADYVLLQADVTHNDAQDIQLLEKMQILGLPTIDFWQNDGKFLSEARLSGFMNEQQFLQHLSLIQAAN